MPLSSGKKLGRYQIVAPLGAGRMGKVHRAKVSRLVHGLPLKSYRDTWRKRAMRLLGRAPHPDNRFDCVSYSDFLHRITVLFGHTHSSAEVRVASNVLLLAGGAQYGDPRLQPMRELS